MRKWTGLISLLCLVAGVSSVVAQSTDRIVEDSLSFSVKQYRLLADTMMAKADRLPKTLDSKGELVTVDSRWWTSGFFPGSLWYLYEFSKEEKFKEYALAMTARVEREKLTTDNHDVGFMIYCSFGNGWRIVQPASYPEVMLTAAKSLSTRFSPRVGCIQSWQANQKWKYPVIIDNMMNLELLLWAYKQSGDKSFYNLAVSHADTTIQNHFRPDFSTYHVVSYDPETGQPMVKQTAQGAADESAWARGQSWGLYGYTMMYRETKLERYLLQARHIADFLIRHPNLPKDKIPYWDYNAPGIPDVKRDASAGAIMASALLELSRYVDAKTKKQYIKVAERQIRSLASPAYRAREGKNGGFLLMHSVGSLPGKSEVDVPLTYADYYFLEALMRWRERGKSSAFPAESTNAFLESKFSLILLITQA